MLSNLKGFRSYISLGLAFVIGGLGYIGVLDSGLAEKLSNLLAIVGLGFVRASIKN